MNFEYTICSQNVGGQSFVGTIPYKVAERWLDNHSEGFESYFMKIKKRMIPGRVGAISLKNVD